MIQPSCAIARHLLVKIERREHSHADFGSARSAILGGCGSRIPRESATGRHRAARLSPPGGAPPTGAHERGHMRRISTGNRSGLCPGKISVNARPIFTHAAREFSDGAIGRTSREWPPDLNDCAGFYVLFTRRVRQHHMMNTPVETIYYQAEPVAQFIGKAPVDYPTNDCRRCGLSIDHIAGRVARLTSRGQRLIALMMSPRSPSSRSVGSSRSENAQIPGSVSLASPYLPKIADISASNHLSPVVFHRPQRFPHTTPSFIKLAKLRIGPGQI